MADQPPLDYVLHNPEVLTSEQLAAFNQAKVTMRLDNEQYLRDHPDVARSIRALMHAILRDRPKNISTFACKFFSRPSEEIRRDLNANS